jgi:hypothetical protein
MTIISTLLQIGLDRRLAYKAKGYAGTDFAEFRYRDGLGWVNETTGSRQPWTQEEALDWLQFMEHFGLEIIATACSCAQCLGMPGAVRTPEQIANREAAARFHAQTGQCVSHGIWPEHMEAEIERLAPQQLRNHDFT